MFSISFSPYCCPVLAAVIHAGMAAIQHQSNDDIVNAVAGAAVLPALDMDGVEMSLPTLSPKAWH